MLGGSLGHPEDAGQPVGRALVVHLGSLAAKTGSTSGAVVLERRFARCDDGRTDGEGAGSGREPGR